MERETLKRLTVLVVDDDEDLLRFATQVLENAGYRVVGAASGEVALTLASTMEGELDLLVTDLIMPGITGGELRERIREMHPECPAIYMSGVNQKRIDELGLKYGAAFLRKPFTAKELVAAAEQKLVLAKAAL